MHWCEEWKEGGEKEHTSNKKKLHLIILNWNWSSYEIIFIIEASAAIVGGVSVLPLRTPVFRGYNGFRLKLDQLKFQPVSNLKEKVCVGFFFFFKHQGSHLVEGKNSQRRGKKPLKENLQLCSVTVLHLKKILCVSAPSEVCAHKPAKF